MGTRSTVKFYQDGNCVLSIYQQYDGYVGGVGRQVLDLLEKYSIVNGLSFDENQKVANGIQELALFYVIDNKTGNGNLYATTENDSQEYNYEIYSEYGIKDTISKIVVYDGDWMIFDGTVDEYKVFVESKE